MTTRAEHLAFCKERALIYIDTHRLDLAYSSLLSDLSKHPETETALSKKSGVLMLDCILLDDAPMLEALIKAIQ